MNPRHAGPWSAWAQLAASDSVQKEEPIITAVAFSDRLCGAVLETIERSLHELIWGQCDSGAAGVGIWSLLGQRADPHAVRTMLSEMFFFILVFRIFDGAWVLQLLANGSLDIVYAPLACCAASRCVALFIGATRGRSTCDRGASFKQTMYKHKAKPQLANHHKIIHNKLQSIACVGCRRDIGKCQHVLIKQMPDDSVAHQHQLLMQPSTVRDKSPSACSYLAHHKALRVATSACRPTPTAQQLHSNYSSSANAPRCNFTAVA